MKNHSEIQSPIRRRKSRLSVMRNQKLLRAALRLWELKHKQPI